MLRSVLKTLALLFSFLELLHLTDGAHMSLPEGMPVCKRSDPNLNECLKDAVQTSIKVLEKGIPSHDIPPLDPLHLHEIKLHEEKAQSVNMALTLSHADLIGLAGVKVTSVDADWDNFRIKINILCGPMSMVGDYDIDGKILVMPISGKGRFTFTFEAGAEGHVELFGSPETRDGMVYMKIDKLNWELVPKHMTIHMDNLFNGDEAKGKSMNAFLNDNWQDIMNEMSPVTSESFAETFKNISKLVFDKVPLDHIAVH